MPIVYRESDAWYSCDTLMQELGSAMDLVGNNEEDAHALLVMVLEKPLPTIANTAKKQVLVIRRACFDS